MQLAGYERTVRRQTENIISSYKNRLYLLEKSEGFSTFKNNIRAYKDTLENTEKIIKKTIDNKITGLARTVAARTEILENQSPVNTLKKGYGLIYKNNSLVKDTAFTVGETAKIVTFRQEIECKVKKIKQRKA